MPRRQIRWGPAGEQNEGDRDERVFAEAIWPELEVMRA